MIMPVERTSYLLEKIELCLDDYIRENGEKRRVGIIANPELYKELSETNLIDFFSQRDIEVCETENLTSIVAKEVRDRSGKMRLPLVLFRRGFFRYHKDITSYELASPIGELAQALAI